MAKKGTKAKTTRATFEVRFVGPMVSPENVPLRAVSDALSALQDIASGRDPYETSSVPQEKSIGLVDVKVGSAVYQCVSRAPDEAIANLRRVARLLDASEKSNGTEDDGNLLISALRPIKSLSEVAKQLRCQLDVRISARKPLFIVTKDDYERISSRVLVSGETTVIGRIQRIGGATRMRCMLRVPEQHHALYCDVASHDLARRLGQHRSFRAIWTWPPGPAQRDARRGRVPNLRSDPAAGRIGDTRHLNRVDAALQLSTRPADPTRRP